ncbi:MAG: lamin tail domain-containing protein [Pseudoxanthomonas sp.]|nr:lamin tail domain-containing protein [Pseudoxanthomonas sp.]
MEMPRGRVAAVLASFALLFAASSVQAQVVISQVYGGGGNSSATLKNDFIELRNNGPTAVDLTGWSVQYTSAAGTTWSGRTPSPAASRPAASTWSSRRRGPAARSTCPPRMPWAPSR